MSEASKFKPALMGGVIVGVLALIPYIAWGGFLWAVLGGIVAAKMLVATSPSALTLGRGAKVGFLTGLIGGGIYLAVNTPLMANSIVEMLIASAQTSPEAQAALAKLTQSPVSKYILSFILSFIIALLLLGFAVIGGMLGVAIFEKRKEETAPATTAAAVVSEKELS
jgi:hypothetical protein